MAQMPLDFLLICETGEEQAREAAEIANSLQSEFLFSRPHRLEEKVQWLSFNRAKSEDLLTHLGVMRKEARGFHPYLLAIVDTYLDGTKFSNIFASDRAEEGLGVLTIKNIPDVIVPTPKLSAYFLYYLAKFCLRFIAPFHENHDDTRDCIYDRKIDKRDLLRSMKSRALCDSCRSRLLGAEKGPSAQQLIALDQIFREAGKILSASPKQSHKPRVFIGSSVEGLPTANALQSLLAHDYYVEVWNQDTVFGLGSSTIEALEKAVSIYDFGVFIFTPDDKLLRRGEDKPVARDNVIFELGLFVGHLGRFRAFVVNPSNEEMSLPSDLKGLTTATYSSAGPNLTAALGPAAQQIRAAISSTRVRGS
jgi:predicted nucleotide-binding protein